MSRNDIRLRRKMITSRRIDRHKDYNSLMSKYRRESSMKRWFKWMALILVIILLLMVIFFIL